MKEHCTTGNEAAAALRAMADDAWKRINRACMEIDRALLPAVQFAVINQDRMAEVTYCNDTDSFTFGRDLKGLVTSLFLKPVPV